VSHGLQGRTLALGTGLAGAAGPRRAVRPGSANVRLRWWRKVDTGDARACARPFVPERGGHAEPAWTAHEAIRSGVGVCPAPPCHRPGRRSRRVAGPWLAASSGRHVAVALGPAEIGVPPGPVTRPPSRFQQCRVALATLPSVIRPLPVAAQRIRGAARTGEEPGPNQVTNWACPASSQRIHHRSALLARAAVHPQHAPVSPGPDLAPGSRPSRREADSAPPL